MFRHGLFRPFLVILLLLLGFVLHDVFLRYSGYKGIRRAGVFSLWEQPRVMTMPAKKPSSVPVKKKSTLLQAGDTLNFLPDTTGNLCDFSDSSASLEKFFRAIADKKPRIRIGYFGDSMIEGDLLTQDLRRLFQEWLGGAGVGFVPVTSPVSGFRQTIRHRFSDNWSQNDISEKFSREKFSPGPSGYTHFTGSEQTWVEYARGSAGFKKPLSLNLWCGRQSKPLSVTLDNNRKLQSLLISDTLPFSVTTLTNSWNGNLLRCSFSSQSGPVYGFSVESDSGVILDNFAFRGNSGTALARIPFRILRQGAEKLQYDLLILHYGLNVASEQSRDYHWYYKGMSHVLSLFQKAFPGVPILLVSISDKGYRDADGNLGTIPGVITLDSLQKQMAIEKKTGFYDLFRAMGGPGSMVDLVNRPYPLANKDFTHVNSGGGRLLAGLIFSDIKKKYLLWSQKKNAG
jgi:hypothetical protein